MGYPQWLDPYDVRLFIMFSNPHMWAMACTAMVIILLYLLRNKLRAWPERTRRVLRMSLAFFMIGCEVLLQLWYVYGGVWSVRTSLPLELCSLSLLLSAVLLLTRSRLLFSGVFFAGIAGALMAIVTPNLGYTVPHFRFIQFFTAHACIILALLYVTWVEQLRPSWRSVVGSMVFVNVAALIAYGTDVLVEANYMFLRHKPETASVLDLLGPYPLYILGEEVLAAVLFSLMYLLFFAIPERMKNRVKKERSSAV